MNQLCTLPFVLALAGCGDALPRAAESDAPVLGHIQSRSERVTIYSGPAGPRFTVRDAGGRVLAGGLSEDELRERHPVLFQRYQQSWAMDASLQQPAPVAQPYR